MMVVVVVVVVVVLVDGGGVPAAPEGEACGYTGKVPRK